MHGFALNVTTDRRFYNVVVPCGIDGVVMTSVRNEAVEAVKTVGAVDSDLWDQTRQAVINGVGAALGVQMTDGNLPDVEGVQLLNR